MKTGFVERLSDEALAALPRGTGASDPRQHEGGNCPVHPLQPISVWWFSEIPGQSWWVPVNTADRHDWSKPCIYRTRKPAAGHPYAKMIAGIGVVQTEKPQKQDTMDQIAQDFTRLVDAIENFLARVDMSERK